MRSSSLLSAMAVPLIAGALGVSISAAGGAPAPRKLRIIQVYTTAETSTSAAVVWNTNVASDSRVQYSTTDPVPPSAPTMYSPSQVTYHEFPLTGLLPGTLYYFKVTSCTRKECATATGSFDTYPSCPDNVPPSLTGISRSGIMLTPSMS
jgi:Purple acid Phosphatase, N-terminal domain